MGNLRKYTLRIFPTPTQTKLLWQYMEARWFVWNWGLDTINRLREAKQQIDWNQLSREFAALRKSTAGLLRLNSHTTRSALHDLKLSMQRYFLNVKKKRKNPNCPKNPYGHPQPKKRFDNHGIFVPDRCRLVNRRLVVFNQRIKVSRDVPIAGKVGDAIRIAYRAGRWYASFTVRMDAPTPSPVEPNNLVGIDIGLKTYAVISDGTEIQNPRWTKQYARKLAHWQRKLARQKKGSNRRDTTKKRIAKIHAAIANHRQHFAHLQSKLIADRYDAICIESHSLVGQMRSPLAKSVADAGQAHFRQCLAYKLPDRGKQLLEAAPFFKSTGICPKCNYDMGRLPLNVRKWTCPGCNTEHNRDCAASEKLELEGKRQIAANQK